MNGGMKSGEIESAIEHCTAFAQAGVYIYFLNGTQFFTLLAHYSLFRMFNIFSLENSRIDNIKSLHFNNKNGTDELVSSSQTGVLLTFD